jgi:hypothetical protein
VEAPSPSPRRPAGSCVRAPGGRSCRDGPARSTLLLSGAERRIESSRLNRQKRLSAALQVGSRRGPARTAEVRDVQLAGCASLEVLHSLCRGETIAAAVDGERQVEPEAADDETQARLDEATEQRFEKLRSQLDLTGQGERRLRERGGLGRFEDSAGVAPRTQASRRPDDERPARRPSMQEPQLTRVESCQAF